MTTTTDPHPLDHESRALWHLELLGCFEPGDAVAPWVPLSDLAWQWEEADYCDDDGKCFDCGQLLDMCACSVGADCGRWRNGRLAASCMKAGSEECDFECPYRDSLRC